MNMKRGALDAIRLGIAGLGRAGRYQLECAAMSPGVRFVAACDSDPRIAQEDLPLRCYTHWADLLADPEVEGVWIATPPESHASLAVEALRAGKPVVLEPPLALDALQAEEVIAAAARHRLPLTVAHFRRYDPDFLQAQQVTQSGQLGELQTLRLTSWQFNPPQLRRSSRGESAWRESSPAGGGILWELGGAALDQLRLLVPASPRSVCARGTPDPDDGFVALIEFDNGAVATLDISRTTLLSRLPHWELTGKLASFAEGMLYRATQEGEIEDLPWDQAFPGPPDFYGQLVQFWRGTGPNPAPAEADLGLLALISAIRRSAETGAAVRLLPAER